MSLPMPTIVAVNGHASATGYILTLVHDYVFMRKDRGFSNMSELDSGAVLTGTFFRAVLRAKISSPAVWRDVETVAAAVELGEQLVKRNWDGQVYAENRKILFNEVLHELTIVETDEMLKNSRILIEEVKSRL
ncbi:hypothetical protein POM88_048629 [Heracleum sosnowskyi]|uniref:Uncharacterized protein n=1 Tax=Heracleum sosnowskyi TaxID=360622 RepID=A0AAD8GVK5_9APIA|nr:hypothetical protein POM88_048629 [Heracleum sosnowskyi]